MCKKLMFLISLVSLLVLVNGVFARDLEWTNESPYSQLACDPLNWEPNDGAPGPGDYAYVNPPPGDGPIFIHDQTLDEMEGPVWDSDDDQYLRILDGDIIMPGGWGVGYDGDGHATVEIGTQPGWGEPNVVIGGLWGFNNAGGVDFIMAGNSRLQVTYEIEIVDDEDHTSNFDLSGNAEMIVEGRFRLANDGVMNFNMSDNASLYVDGEWRNGDNSDGELNLVMTGNSTAIVEDNFRVGDDGSATILIADNAVLDVGYQFRLEGRKGSTTTVTQTGGTVNIDDNAELGRAGWDDGIPPGTQTWNITGPGVVNVGGNFEMGRNEDALVILGMYDCNAAVTVDGELRAPEDDEACAEIYLHGGVLDVSAFTHDGDCWLLDICECGVMIIDGDVVDEILADMEAGNITVCGYYMGCGAQYDIQVDYNNVNPGHTTIWLEGDPYQPYDPDPGCCTDPDAEPVPSELCLSWTPGDAPCPPPLEFYVYLSTDIEKMEIGDLSAHIATTTANSICVEDLCLGATYYWRLDAVCDCYTAHGDVWCFTVQNCMTLDDFEGYDNSCDPTGIFYTWLDGAGNCGGVGGNGTGSSVYSATDPDPMQDDKVMEYYYNSTGWEREYPFSEANQPLDTPLDLTDECEKVLVLWFYGDADNTTEDMWVALSDGTNDGVVTYGTLGPDSPDDIKNEEWKDFIIDLQDFVDAGVDTSAITEISIGFGERGRTGEFPGDPMGLVYFDDLTLCSTICVPRYAPDGDVDDDCDVDWDDVDLMVGDWLEDLCP
ncbi:MAG: hypothetical protein ACYS8I_07955 [Planctomycetota bacterium]